MKALSLLLVNVAKFNDEVTLEAISMITNYEQ
jgi:hypothetical protein